MTAARVASQSDEYLLDHVLGQVAVKQRTAAEKTMSADRPDRFAEGGLSFAADIVSTTPDRCTSSYVISTMAANRQTGQGNE